MTQEERSVIRLKNWITLNLRGEWIGKATFQVEEPQKVNLPKWIQVAQEGNGSNDYLLAQGGARIEIIAP